MRTLIDIRTDARVEKDAILNKLNTEYDQIEARRFELMKDETPANERHLRSIERIKAEISKEYDARYNVIRAEEYAKAEANEENIYDM
jgi:hypothetical protein